MKNTGTISMLPRAFTKLTINPWSILPKVSTVQQGVQWKLSLVG